MMELPHFRYTPHKTSIYGMWYDGLASFMMGSPHDGLPSFIEKAYDGRPVA